MRISDWSSDVCSSDLLSGPKASVQVKTISTYYKSTASKLPTYSAFYKEKEKPTATDEEFIASDEFALDLDDFYARVAQARSARGDGRQCRACRIYIPRKSWRQTGRPPR